MKLPIDTVIITLCLSIKPSIKPLAKRGIRRRTSSDYAELDNVRMAWQWASRHADLAGLIGLVGSLAFLQQQCAFSGRRRDISYHARIVTDPGNGQLRTHAPDRSATGGPCQLTQCLRSLRRSRDPCQRASHLPKRSRMNHSKPRLRSLGKRTLSPSPISRSAGVLRTRVGATQGRFAAAGSRYTQTTCQYAPSQPRLCRARTQYVQALTLYRQQRNRPGEGEVLNDLGWCSQQQHEFKRRSPTYSKPTNSSVNR